jgi:uncharacterized protein YndB with AHSA1/START domain
MPNRKFDWSQFTLKVPIAAPAEKVFRLWTDKEQIKNWFLSDASMNLKKGGDYEWTWFLGDKQKGKILNYKKSSKFTFTFAEGKCDLTVKKDKRGSMVILHQYDIPNTESGRKIHISCSSGWTFYLTNLKTYLEYGIDLREKDPKYITMGTVLY